MFKRLMNSLPVKTAKAYGASNASNFGSGLAFNGFLTMFPLLLGILSAVGLVIQDPAMQQKVQGAMIGVFPSDAHAQLLQALSGVKRNAGLLGIVSIAGLVWTGTGLFASMEFALTEVFGTTQRDMLRQRAMGVIMTVVFLAAVVVAVTANNAAAVLPFMPYTGFVVGLVAMVALLVAIYRFVPNRTFRLRDVWPGAVLAGVLIEALTLAFPLYARLSHGFNTYGQQFALFFLLAAWLYFLSQILLLGAVFNRLRVGDPAAEGLIPTEPGKGEVAPRPVEAIKGEQGVAPTAAARRDARRARAVVPFPVAIAAALAGWFAGIFVGRSAARASR